MEKEKNRLEKIVLKEDFWNDVSLANKTYQQLKIIQKQLKIYNDLLDQIHILLELLEMGESIFLEDIENIKKEVDELEIDTLLTGEYDSFNCYLEIHPGAGGTESCDWASMLFRMYQRFLESNN